MKPSSIYCNFSEQHNVYLIEFKQLTNSQSTHNVQCALQFVWLCQVHWICKVLFCGTIKGNIQHDPACASEWVCIWRDLKMVCG